MGRGPVTKLPIAVMAPGPDLPGARHRKKMIPSGRDIDQPGGWKEDLAGRTNHLHVIDVERSGERPGRPRLDVDVGERAGGAKIDLVRRIDGDILAVAV